MNGVRVLVNCDCDIMRDERVIAKRASVVHTVGYFSVKGRRSRSLHGSETEQSEQRVRAWIHIRGITLHNAI